MGFFRGGIEMEYRFGFCASWVRSVLFMGVLFGLEGCRLFFVCFVCSV